MKGLGKHQKEKDTRKSRRGTAQCLWRESNENVYRSAQDGQLSDWTPTHLRPLIRDNVCGVWERTHLLRELHDLLLHYSIVHQKLLHSGSLRFPIAPVPFSPLLFQTFILGHNTIEAGRAHDEQRRGA